jgi:hypothetical protein
VLYAAGLEADFGEFFPELIEHVSRQGISSGSRAGRPLIPEEVCP